MAILEIFTSDKKLKHVAKQHNNEVPQLCENLSVWYKLKQISPYNDIIIFVNEIENFIAKLNFC